MGFAQITDEELTKLRNNIGMIEKTDSAAFYSEISTDAARHFALAMGDDNPLWTDPKYASKTRWGKQLAPPCILYSADNIVSGAVKGLPSVHAMFAGTSWRWHSPLYVGTKLDSVARLKDVVEHKTEFAGRSVQQIYQVDFFDQEGTKIAEADSWVFRTERDTARESKKKYSNSELTKPHCYSKEDISRVFEHYRNEKRRGADVLSFDDVKVGDKIGPILKGPYTVTSAVAFMQAWGNFTVPNHRLAYRFYDKHPKLAAPNEQGIPEPPVRVHWDNDFARLVGAPAAYDFGPERVAWAAHLITDWMGDDAFLKALSIQIRRHNPIGDSLWIGGVVTEKSLSDGRPTIKIDVWGKNQNDLLSIKGTAEVELPKQDIPPGQVLPR